MAEKSYIAQENTLQSILTKLNSVAKNSDVSNILTMLQNGIKITKNRKYNNIKTGYTRTGVTITGSGIICTHGYNLASAELTIDGNTTIISDTTEWYQFKTSAKVVLYNYDGFGSSVQAYYLAMFD